MQETKDYKDMNTNTGNQNTYGEYFSFNLLQRLIICAGCFLDAIHYPLDPVTCTCTGPPDLVKYQTIVIINRPSVAGAVLQTPPSLLLHFEQAQPKILA